MKRARPILLSTWLMLLGATSCQTWGYEFVAQDVDARTVAVRFRGLDNFDQRTAALLLEKQALEISRTGPGADLEPVKTALAKIYRSDGFADVTVDATLQESESKELQLDLIVVEGPRVLVDEILIEGNHSIPSTELLQNWRRRASGILALGPPVFVERDIVDFARTVLAIYQSNGYLEAEVPKPSITREPSETRARVVINVREGPLYSVLRMRVDKTLAERVDELPPSLEGKPFSAAEAENFRRRLVDSLREAGHPDPVAKLMVGAVNEKNGVDILIRGDAGEKLEVGEVVVRGNESVRAEVVLDAFDIETGQLFRGSAEDAGVRRLLASGDFRRVDVKHEVRDDGRLRLAIEVEEVVRPPIDLEIGYGSYVRARGGLRLDLDNVFESGLDVRAKAEAHAKGHVLSASIIEPDLFADTSLSIGAAQSRRRQPSYSDKLFATEAVLRRRIAGPLEARLGYRFEDHHGSWSDTRTPALDMASYDSGTLFADFISVDRDRPVRTRDGHAAHLTIDWSDESIGGDIDLLRLSLDATKWISISDRITVSARARSGVLWPQRSTSRLPIQERFFNGGENKVRSFREDQLGPKDLDGEAIGGQFRNTFNLETRFALHDPLDVVLFADAGNVGRRHASFGLSKLRYALGTGLQYVLPPRIPIRFDVAWNPDRNRGESEWVMHFRMGQID